MKNEKMLKNTGILGIVGGALMTLATFLNLTSIDEMVEEYPMPGTNTLFVRLFSLAIIALALKILYNCTKVLEQTKIANSNLKLASEFLIISAIMLIIGNTTILDAGIAGFIIFFALLYLASGILGIIGGVMYMNNKNKL